MTRRNSATGSLGSTRQVKPVRQLPTLNQSSLTGPVPALHETRTAPAAIILEAAVGR